MRPRNQCCLTNNERPIRVSPLEFDQGHKLTGIMDVRAGGTGPKSETPMCSKMRQFLFTASVRHTRRYELSMKSQWELFTGSSRDDQFTDRALTYRLDLKANKSF
jgi:hypothetical protein